MELQHSAWRPAHPILDKKIVEQKPEAYVLIEDIDFALHFYRDANSLAILLDLLADHLELPTIFSCKGIKSEFGFSKVETSLKGIFKG